MSTAGTVQLELDDIQRGALHARPAPYVGTYLLLRIDDRHAGRELVRRLASTDRFWPIEPRSIGAGMDHGRLHIQRAEGTGRRAGLARQLCARVSPGNGRTRGGARRCRRQRTRALGIAARNARCACGVGSALVGRRAARSARGTGAASAGAAARYRADLAAGLLPAADGTDVVRLQGRDRAAGDRGQRHPAHESDGAPDQAGRVHPRVSGRDGIVATDPDAFRARTQRHVFRVSQASHPRCGIPPVPSRSRRFARRGGIARSEDRRALAERRAARGRSR